MSSISSTQILSLNKQFKQLNIRNVDIEKIYESSIYSPYSDDQQIIFSKMYDNRIYLANGFYFYNIANGLEKNNFINAVFLRSNKCIVLGKNNFYKSIQLGVTDTNISTSYPAKIIGTRNLSDIFYEIHLDGTIIKVDSGNSAWEHTPVAGSRKQLLGKKVYNNLIFQGFKDNELFFINKTENNIFELIKLTNAGKGNSGFEMPSDLIEVIVPDLGLYNLKTSDINNIKHILAVPFYQEVGVKRVYILFKNGLLKYLRLNGDTTVRMVEDKIYSIAYRNNYTISYFNAETFKVKDFNIIQEISYSNLDNIRLMDSNGICVRVAPGASIGGSLIDEFLYGSGSSGSSGSGIGTNNVDLFLNGVWNNKYYINGQETTLNQNGTGAWNDKYYISGVQTTLDQNGNGFYFMFYYINGQATTLDENGSGTWNGQNYTNGILDS